MSDSDQGLSDLLPDQIIWEILTRLPAKSIHRFKCVSKRFLSQISSPQFISSFLSLSSPSWAIVNRFIRVAMGPTDPTLSLSLADPARSGPSTFLITPFLSDGGDGGGVVDDDGRKNVAVIGGNGLLLFGVKRKRDPYEEREKNPNYFSIVRKQNIMVICNPVTQHWFQIPKPKEPINHLGAIGLATRASGPNGLVISFVVVEYQPIIGSEVASLLTFSSVTGKWDSKCGNYELGMHFWRSEGSFEFDGCLFFVDLSFGLVAWDEPFSGEKRVRCRFISLPGECRRDFNTPGLEKTRSIEAGGGHIQFIDVSNEGSYGGLMSLWRLKNHKEEEWDLVHKVSLNDVWSDESYLGCGLSKMILSPKLFHPFETNVVFFVVGDCLISVNVATRKVVSCCSYSNLDDELCVLPFVFPSWPTSLPPLIIALAEKDRGNEYFKESKFNEAISCYSRSIISSPMASTYANRAAAYLKITGYLQAEIDCTEALKLDENYMKAYARRAIAKKELGKLEEAKEDAELALKLEPKQPEILKQYAEIKFLLDKATIKRDGDEDGIASQP